jgi:hypothetical protein
MMADLDVLFGRVIGLADRGPERRFVRSLTDPLDGRIAIQGLV